MAIILTDPNVHGPFPTFGIKDVQVKVLKTDSSFYSTAGVNTLLAKLPADVTIIKMDTWVRTVLSGNGVTSPTIAVGTTSGGNDISAAFSITNTAGTLQTITPAVGIMQTYNPPYTSDISIYVRGGCSTGNPTAGEIDLVIYYIR